MANKREDSFENKMERLKQIVSTLEAENIDLDNSIKLYSEGLMLSKELKDELNKYADKVKELGESNE